MSERFVVIDAATGEILREGWCATGMAARQARSAGQIGEVPQDDVTATEHYRSPESGHYVSRPEMALSIDRPVITADGIAMATISGIPDGAEIQAEGRRFANWTQGSFTVSSEQIGRLVVTIRRFPYKDSVVRIETIDGGS